MCTSLWIHEITSELSARERLVFVRVHYSGSIRVRASSTSPAPPPHNRAHISAKLQEQPDSMRLASSSRSMERGVVLRRRGGGGESI